MAKSTAVTLPNLGLYLGRPPGQVPLRALQNGYNFRIKEGRLSNWNLGWNKYSAVNFGGPVTLISTFNIRGAAEKQIIGTNRDLFEYDTGSDSALYLNPRYAVGTLNVSDDANAAVTVNTGSPTFLTVGVKPGDFIAFGNNAQRDPNAVWYEIDAVGSETTLTIDGAVTGAPLTNVSYTIRQTFTGTDDIPWDFDVFVSPDDGTGDDLWFATNGMQPVVSWDGQATQVTVEEALGFTCKRLTVYKNMMIYANITDSGEEFPTSFINSDIGNPRAAGDVGTGLSEQFRVHDGVDGINEIEDLGDNLVIYSPKHVVLCQFVGDPLVFIFREVANGLGPIASRLVADFGDYHQFIAEGSQWLFDGVSVTEVGKQVWREVLRLRDPVRHDIGFHHFDEEQGELHWVVALTSDPGVGVIGEPPVTSYVEHFLEEVGDRVPAPFSARNIPFRCSGYGIQLGSLSWDEITETWEELTIRWNESQLFSAFPTTLMGGQDGFVYVLNTLQTADGVVMPSFVHFGRRPMYDGNNRGLLTRVYPFLPQLVAGLTVTTTFADHASGPNTITQTNTFDQTLLEGVYFVNPYRVGRYFEVQFGTAGDAWTLDGYDIERRVGGFR